MSRVFMLMYCLLQVASSYAQTGKIKIIGKPVAKTILEVSLPANAFANSEISYHWYLSADGKNNWKPIDGVYTSRLVLLSSYADQFVKTTVSGKDKKGKAIILEAVTAKVQDKGNPNTDWFKKSALGLMVHFLKDVYLENGTAEDWNKIVDGFDTEKFAEDCKTSRVAYVLFALGQNSGYYCAPNKAYDSIVGVQPGALCSRRDLPADLIVSLKKRGIRLLFYLPGNPPISNRLVTDRFKYTFGKDSPTSVYTQACWEAVIKEWSVRYGKGLHGWWFDGMYSGGIIETRSDMSLPHNISTHTLAAKAGNIESIVSYNYGVQKIKSNSSYDDYSAGEKQQLDELPFGRWVEPGVQWFFFTYLGKTWSEGGTQFTTEQLNNWAASAFDKQGVLCFDVQVNASGAIDPQHIEQLKAVKNVFDNTAKK